MKPLSDCKRADLEAAAERLGMKVDKCKYSEETGLLKELILKSGDMSMMSFRSWPFSDDHDVFSCEINARCDVDPVRRVMSSGRKISHTDDWESIARDLLADARKRVAE